jgi:hypothetical protein
MKFGRFRREDAITTSDNIDSICGFLNEGMWRLLYQYKKIYWKQMILLKLVITVKNLSGLQDILFTIQDVYLQVLLTDPC